MGLIIGHGMYGMCTVALRLIMVQAGMIRKVVDEVMCMQERDGGLLTSLRFRFLDGSGVAVSGARRLPFIFVSSTL